MQRINYQDITPPQGHNKRLFRWFLIFLILLVAGGTLSFRAYNRELVSDDLLYSYVLDEHPLGRNDYSHKVENLSDAIRSQTTQYFYSNGRTIVHVFVQMFAGPWGILSYSIFLGLLGIGVISLFNIYTLSNKSLRNPIFWLLTTIAYLYLFQSNSRNWYSIAGGLNYLYPMLPVLITLIIFNCITNKKVTPKKPSLILLAILGILTGWSHECFSLPLSGGLFFYCLFYFKKINKTASIWWLILPIWLGTAILVLAPGNFMRLGYSKGLSMLFNGIELLIGTYLFWLLALFMLFVRITSKDLLRSFFKENRLNFYILATSIAFGLAANTLPQSFNGVSFYSAILLFRLLDKLYCANKSDDRYSVRLVYYILTVIILIPLCINQYRIIDYSHSLKKLNHQFIEDYKASATGIMRPMEVEFPWDVRPFISDWFKSGSWDWTMLTIEKVFGKEKPLIVLKGRDYTAYSDSANFVNENPKVVSNQFYIGDRYVWFDKKLIEPGDSLLMEVIPIEKDNLELKIRKIKRNLTGFKPQTYPFTISVDTLRISGNSDLIGIPKRNNDISEIKIIRH